MPEKEEARRKSRNISLPGCDDRREKLASEKRASGLRGGREKDFTGRTTFLRGTGN